MFEQFTTKRCLCMCMSVFFLRKSHEQFILTFRLTNRFFLLFCFIWLSKFCVFKQKQEKKVFCSHFTKNCCDFMDLCAKMALRDDNIPLADDDPQGKHKIGNEIRKKLKNMQII